MDVLSNNEPKTGGDRFDLPQERRTGALVDRTDVLRRQASEVHISARELNENATQRDLEIRQASVAKKAPLEILAELSELGFAWRDVARMVGVSVPAVQKWRRGEGVSAENRQKLAGILALVEMLRERFVNEPESWLEMPIKPEVPVSPIDLIAGGRFDLVLSLASNHHSVSPETVLNEFEPDWRATHVDNAFETFVASDGVVSIRARTAEG